MAKKIEYLLVDGYNIIYSWKSLKSIADDSLENARIKLIDILCDYQGFKQIEVIVVFDAHRVKGGVGVSERYNNIWVVYTKEAETADNYIERTTNRLVKETVVRVATSDNLEQVIILGRGALRMSARELQYDIEKAKESLRKDYIENRPVKSNLLLDNLDEETARQLEQIRRRRS